MPCSRLVAVTVTGRPCSWPGGSRERCRSRHQRQSPSKAFGGQQVGSDSSDIPPDRHECRIRGHGVRGHRGHPVRRRRRQLPHPLRHLRQPDVARGRYVHRVWAFHPLSIGATSATLSIASQSAAPPAHVPLTGTGTRVPEDPRPPRGVTAAAGNSFATVRWLAPRQRGSADHELLGHRFARRQVLHRQRSTGLRRAWSDQRHGVPLPRACLEQRTGRRPRPGIGAQRGGDTGRPSHRPARRHGNAAPAAGPPSPGRLR